MFGWILLICRMEIFNVLIKASYIRSILVYFVYWGFVFVSGLLKAQFSDIKIGGYKSWAQSFSSEFNIINLILVTKLKFHFWFQPKEKQLYLTLLRYLRTLMVNVQSMFKAFNKVTAFLQPAWTFLMSFR